MTNPRKTLDAKDAVIPPDFQQTGAFLPYIEQVLKPQITADGLPHLTLAVNSDNTRAKENRKFARDCAKKPCRIGGHDYQDQFDIPGNRPVPFLQKDGTPVKADGREVFGPDRADLKSIADKAKSMFSAFEAARKNIAQPFSSFLDPKTASSIDNTGRDLSIKAVMVRFAHGGEWDFQRLHTDDKGILFSDKYKDFTNIAIGYVGAALGLTAKESAQLASDYCRDYDQCKFHENMDPDFPRLAKRDVEDYKIGWDLYNHGKLG